MVKEIFSFSSRVFETSDATAVFPGKLRQVMIGTDLFHTSPATLTVAINRYKKV